MSERVFFAIENRFIHRDAISHVEFNEENDATIYLRHPTPGRPYFQITGVEAQNLRVRLQMISEDVTDRTEKPGVP